MKLDPSEEDSDDSGNGGRDSPVGEAGQVTDLEVCHLTVSFWPLPHCFPRLRVVLLSLSPSYVTRKKIARNLGDEERPQDFAQSLFLHVLFFCSRHTGLVTHDSSRMTD